jgi:CheY-like chemotaxis protein
MAFNGKDALDIISGDQNNTFVPDYIFVDLNMPVMDGFEFIQSFHSLPVQGKENTMIVVLTSSNNSNDRSRAIRLGVENYVVKPIKAPDLFRILQC